MLGFGERNPSMNSIRCHHPPWSSQALLLLLLPLALAFAGCQATTRNTHLRPEAVLIPPGSTIAVVPFENLSSSRNAGLALTDLATSVLYAHDYFRVLEVSALQDDRDVRFRRLEISPWERQLSINTAAAAAAGRSLKSDSVLTGCVGEYGFVDGFGETAAVSLSVRLVRSTDAEVVWAGALSRRVSSFAFSEESAQRLAHQILRELLGRMVSDLTIQNRRLAKGEK